MEITDTNPIETLESEVKKFADGLTYWGKFIADKILSGDMVNQADMDLAYTYLLEELKLKEDTVKPSIVIGNSLASGANYSLDLQLKKLDAVEGVNALIENQQIEFCPNLTIIYGTNGSGKSGYIRLLKKSFYSKAKEDIISNIHVSSKPKKITAQFTFQSASGDIQLRYPDNASQSEFEQFAVFDGKSVLFHLDQKNKFEFRPSGLNFFAHYTEAIKRLEEKLNAEIATKTAQNNFSILFDGESDIKALIDTLSHKTKVTDLEKHLPFSDEDKTAKKKVEKEYDDLLLASKNKDKDILVLEKIKQLVISNKQTIIELNNKFTTEQLEKLYDSIKDCIDKEELAKKEGIENFNTDKIQHVGSNEWKNFIKSAEAFAASQHESPATYPLVEDNCLLCQQPLSDTAKVLISDYWKFIKSVAEENARKAQQHLNQVRTTYKGLKFDLFPAENTLTVWLEETNPELLNLLKESTKNLEELSEKVIVELENKNLVKHTALNIPVSHHDEICTAIDDAIVELKADAQGEKLAALLKQKTLLAHKEKLELHIDKIKKYLEDLQWVAKARKISWRSIKVNVTEWEKYLSGKYFNDKYIDLFNKECEALRGDFGVSINHTGSAGTSFRQLFIKGNNPSVILSEGEQKVIALADFLSEMQLSEVNRGIIFDDPVTSLDEGRKKNIGIRLAEEARTKQVVIFTHDLIFVSNLITYCQDNNVPFQCHWIESRDNVPGYIWLHNAPSYEKEYRNAEPAKKLYSEAKKEDCPPAQREFLISSGFTALRTCYEVLVINDLFKNVVQRYEERVSVQSLDSVYFDNAIIEEIMDSFAQCCRYMLGHTHSDKYAYVKPDANNLNDEINRYEALRTKIKKLKKPAA